MARNILATIGGASSGLVISRAFSDVTGALDAVAGGTSNVTHGSQITTANTGYAAYYRADLGRLQTLSDLTTVSGTHYLTDFTSGGTGGTSTTPKVLTGYRFTGDVVFDANYITTRGCLFDNPPTAYRSGVHAIGALLDYCTVSPSTVGDQSMSYESWSANRCYFRGSSDGAKINGGTLPINITECYIRTKMQAADDHNDGLQNVGGAGNVYVQRCNISVNPEGGLLGGGASGGPNGTIMSADMAAGTNFHLEVVDCLLDGTNSAYTVRFYDGGISSGITYVATGNRFVRSSSVPLHRGAANITPTGQITWSGNVWDDDNSSIALV